MEGSISETNNTVKSVGAENNQQRPRDNKQRRNNKNNKKKNNQVNSDPSVLNTPNEGSSIINKTSGNRNKNRNRNRKNNNREINIKERDDNNYTSNSNNNGSILKSNKKKNKHPPKYMEIQRLFHKYKPITINGIPPSLLSKPVNEFVLDLVSDKSNQEGIYIAFLMKPSDPDFPYELDFLKISLAIPSKYPGRSDQVPSVTVLNDDIPRGFSVNIELGFQQIVATALKNRQYKKNGRKVDKEKSSTPVSTSTIENEEDNDGAQKIEIISGNDLVGMVLTLDKYLERFLSMEKKDTIKIVKYIKKQQGVGKKEDKEKKEKEKEGNEKKKKNKDKKPENIHINDQLMQKRNLEIEKMKQRLRLDNVKLFKETAHNSIYKMSLSFMEENFTIEIENMEEIVIENLNIKLTIPKDYLSNSKKGLKLELDMSSNYNLKLISSINDKNLKLIFGKLITNINNNFNHLGSEVAKLNVVDNKESEVQSSQTNLNSNYWSITSQLNFFVQNIEKFLSPVNEFTKWMDNNRLFNECL